MSNGYFDYDNNLVSGTRARATEVSAVFELIEDGFDILPTATEFTDLVAAVAALVAGSGVLVSANDTTTGFLNGKLVAGEGISFTENNDGANETLTLETETYLKSRFLL